ncbi:MAG: SufE family protein [Gammaproteobacteria bacterium]|nr:SufE family protein [Gammaproteobacteria bacterium]MDP2140492.1 SufE family protein [Gammaproteobacteria bacterium]MDP2348801.1 SufE family protein [Gammaproteobacteria bacterium]
MAENRFGIHITPEDIIEALSFFDSWEDRYKYIIDLGKELPPLDPTCRTDDNLVRGCQSQVWLIHRDEGDKLFFEVDSDAFIVRGLLGVVLAAYNGKTREQIRDFDINAYFDQLNLIKHLSPTRGSGLQAMVRRIQALAST